ncbi:hypothetical protein PTI98_004286 [Pleurotus ostreatus]|nr:hypothetical protein PTI98_004286 [Pleurotus ostreatus]
MIQRSSRGVQLLAKSVRRMSGKHRPMHAKQQAEEKEALTEVCDDGASLWCTTTSTSVSEVRIPQPEHEPA